jgi:diguanylate cyclase (GGDEF)-like protein
MAVSKLNIKKLIKMGDLLSSSFTLEEAYNVISREMPQLFAAGAFYEYNSAKGFLESKAQWGVLTGEAVFAPDDCLAVRRNRPHLVAGTEKGLPCPHFEKAKDDSPSICIPMRLYGEFIGIMHLRMELPADGNARAASRKLGADKQLAVLAARHIGLTMKNLQFREYIIGQSAKDTLTGLVSRRFIEEILTREIKKAQREKVPVGVIFMDIDHLGYMNQTYGLETGERIIRDLGAFLGEHFQGKDIACRWGADEFVIILPGSSVEAACRRAENIRGMLKDHAMKSEHMQMRRVTLSMGVVAFPDHGEEAADLLESAKTAVKRAKEEGRNRVKVAT